jgi:hypothetical protein
VTIRAGENLKALMARANRATSIRGKKTELAKFLGARLSHVCDWLSGTVAPNGEVTLLMLEWVTAEEGKNKSGPGGAINTTRTKTRSTQSTYEKRKTSPHNP